MVIGLIFFTLNGCRKAIRSWSIIICNDRNLDPSSHGLGNNLISSMEQRQDSIILKDPMNYATTEFIFYKTPLQILLDISSRFCKKSKGNTSIINQGVLKCQTCIYGCFCEERNRALFTSWFMMKCIFSSTFSISIKNEFYI